MPKNEIKIKEMELILKEKPRPQGYTQKDISRYLGICRQTASSYGRKLLKKRKIKILDKLNKNLSIKDLESKNFSKPLRYFHSKSEIQKRMELLFNPFVSKSDFLSLMLTKYLCVKFCEENFIKFYEQEDKVEIDAHLNFALKLIRAIIFSFDSIDFFEVKFKDRTNNIYKKLIKLKNPDIEILEKHHIRDKRVEEMYKVQNLNYLNDLIEQTKKILDTFCEKLENSTSIKDIIKNKETFQKFRFIKRFMRILDYDLRHNLRFQVKFSKKMEIPFYWLTKIQQRLYNVILQELFMNYYMYEQMVTIEDLGFNLEVSYNPNNELISFIHERSERFDEIKILINEIFGIEKEPETPFLNWLKAHPPTPGAYGGLGAYEAAEANLHKKIAQDLINYYNEKEKELLLFEKKIMDENIHLRKEIEDFGIINKFYNSSTLPVNNILEQILKLNIDIKELLKSDAPLELQINGIKERIDQRFKVFKELLGEKIELLN